MEDILQRIKNWAGHGTPKQFLTEISAKIEKEGYQAEMVGNVLTCYRTVKKGGFLGLGGTKSKQVVLRVIWQDNQILVPKEDADEQFVRMLGTMLKQH